MILIGLFQQVVDGNKMDAKQLDTKQHQKNSRSKDAYDLDEDVDAYDDDDYNDGENHTWEFALSQGIPGGMSLVEISLRLCVSRGPGLR